MLSDQYPEIAAEWDPQNSKTPCQVAAQSHFYASWVCSKGHGWNATVQNRTVQGQGCPHCAGKYPTSDNNLLVRFPQVASQWHPQNDKGPEQYLPMSNKCVWWRCSVGHEWQAKISKRSMGQGCPYCSNRRVGADNNLAMRYPEVAAEWHPTKNQESSDKVPSRTKRKAWWLCPQGHSYHASIGHRTRGSGCPYCSGREASEGNNLADCHPMVAAEWHPINDKLPDRFTPKSDVKVWWQCSKGHAWEATIHNRVSLNHHCPHCTQHGTSRAEQDVLQFIQSQTSEAVLHRDKSLGFEVDIYIPSLKLAIEYTGLIWHSTKFHRNPRKHVQDKHSQCEALGVRLITVFEDEWLDHRETVEGRLKSILGQGQRKFARKLECKPIDNRVARDFCHQYHLQGKGQSKVAYGLFEGETLLSAMTFSKGSRAKGNHGDWEVNRFCSKPGWNVVGGASRLFKAFLRDHNPTKVISYCDRRWGLGKVYEAMGMDLVSSTPPNYWYLVGNGRIHRFVYRKQELLRQFGGDPALTERQLAEQQGLYRVYDAGSLKYEWTAKL